MIPESFINELLNRVDVVDIIDKRVPLKKAGANFVACCPFHQEKTPSFSVSPSKQFYHCFGCGAHGSAISFLIDHDGLNFIDSIQELAKVVGLKVPNQVDEKPEKKKENIILEDSLILAKKYYQAKLKDSPQAIQYLKSRGLTGEIAKEFSIGFAPEGWNNLNEVFKDYDNDALIKSGLISKNDKGKRYDRFRNRIMFPIYNAKGQLVGFGGRVIDENDTPKYYNSPETSLFQKSYELYGLLAARKAIREKGYVLVVEGYMDVVSLAQHGIRNVVATLGTATTSFHIQKLMRYTPEIIFCFDGDNAGKSAAWRAMKNSLTSVTDEVQLKFLFLSDQHDPDSYVRQHSKEKFEDLAKHAIPLSEYIIQYLTQNNNLNSQEERVKFLNEVGPILENIASSKLTFLFKKRISVLLDLTTDELDKVIKVKNKGNTKPPAQQLKRQTTSVVRRFVSLLILDPTLVKKSDQDIAWGDTLDEQLAQTCIAKLLTDEDHNTASIFHFLNNRFDNDFIDEIKSQVLNFDEKMSLNDELDGLRKKIKQKKYQTINKSKLDAIKHKSFNTLSPEEKEFLKAITKR
ncbi:MAG: DNA primase [Nitrosomonadales bacterium]|jgi:DNA primase|nr:DNA primase [Nitrosomonadales bacterium]MBT3918379.1 DNA primase [Nitrosomonadales bacterium]MBT4183076.1 DNA primase [Nitrosomonadales bacterium]MBT4571118.1 DNA primase [Nitrosomonadales bacterium]MBT5150335.1 DNA primase [Nitrosomonadales bacterium]